MSPKFHSLAYDETVKEFDSHLDSNFEPELTVIVNTHYVKTPAAAMASQDVIHVNGRITVSF